MRVRINLKSDPISLTIIAATGHEHEVLESAEHDNLIEVAILEGDVPDEIPNPEPGPI